MFWSGYRVCFTDAIYGDHLLAERGTLWLGKDPLMRNVLHMACRGGHWPRPSDHRIETRLLYLIQQSELEQRSIPWSPA